MTSAASERLRLSDTAEISLAESCLLPAEQINLLCQQHQRPEVPLEALTSDYRCY